jgi:hypothetical protein
VLHPGVVRTGFAAEDPPPMWPLVRLFLKTPEQGTSSRSSYDTATAARLWQISLDLVAPTATAQAAHEPQSG